MLLLEKVLLVTRDLLRDELENITQIDKSIRITDDEKVPTYAGEEFINLYGATVSNEYPLEQPVRKEVYSITIGITRRLQAIPTDVSAESIYVEDLITRTKSTMIRRAYEIINHIDGNWGIPALIRQDTDLTSYDFCITSPLGFSNSSPLVEKWAEHFRLDDDSERPQALFLELTFSGLTAYFKKDVG